MVRYRQLLLCFSQARWWRFGFSKPVGVVWFGLVVFLLFKPKSPINDGSKLSMAQKPDGFSLSFFVSLFRIGMRNWAD